jgi:hypothetical protein
MTEDMFQSLLVFLGLMALLGTVAKITMTLIHRRRPELPKSSVSLDDISRQIAALQHSVDATAIEVERLGESQRFTTKLLAERGVPEAVASDRDSVPDAGRRR